MMTKEQVDKALKEYCYPYAYSHFTEEVKPPFLVLLNDSTNNLKADDAVYYKVDNLEVELYTRKDFLKEEKKLEDYFDTLGLSWEKTNQSWIDEEKLMMSVYSVG